jgi:acetyl esterase/lipase
VKGSRRRALTALALVAPALLTGCSNVLLAIANGADVVSSAYSRRTDLAYGALPRERADVYLPSPSTAGPRRAIVFIHGGGWNAGSKDSYRFVAAGLASAGFVVVVPNYRLHPAAKMADALQDVAAAVAWTQANGRLWGVSTDGVIVVGHSAGAHLAAMLATDGRWLAHAGAAPLAGFAGFAGPYDFLPLTDPVLMDYFGPPDRYPDSQPVNFVSPASPPAFLVHGADDVVVEPRNTTALAQKLRAAGVPVQLFILAGEGHAQVLVRFARMNRHDDVVYRALLDFLTSPQSARESTMPAAAGGLR